MGLTIDMTESLVISNDLANRFTVERTTIQSIRAMLFTNTANAAWLSDKLLRSSAYPLCRLSLKANRNVFDLIVGDLFRFSYEQYGIDQMVFRILNITEESLDSEIINIDAIEDIDYLASQKVSETAPEGDRYIRLLTLAVLENVKVIEMPYIVGGNNLGIIPLVARETGTETGYIVYMSVDGGNSYTQIQTTPTYNPFGELVYDYSDDTYKVDDDDGFYINFYNDDVDIIETTTRTNLFIGTNTALLGDEIISFETITPVSGTIYKIENIVRGLFDTERMNHTAGEDFYYIGTTNYTTVASPNISAGTTRFFKLVPVNSAGIGEISEAVVIEQEVDGRAKTPYKPSNLKANGAGLNATYFDDVILTWYGRIRGAGAGIGVLDSVVGEAPTFEGYFKLEVLVGGSVVRTVNNIEALTYTYTEAMNISDNGSLAGEIEFRLYNCIIDTSVVYCSGYSTISVTKE